MNPSSLRRARSLVAALVTGVAALSGAQAAQATPPPSLAPPAGNVPFLLGHGDGVQNYRCAAAAPGFTWQFVAPRATLTDDRGNVIISHFGGPSWQANDGSKVVGKLVSSRTVSRRAIPWLLLTATSSPAPEGGGVLADATFVQRLRTHGGLAPDASTCDARTAGVTAEVPYTADYVFWKALGA
jgi:S-formylglutathione hydrolase FrmB